MKDIKILDAIRIWPTIYSGLYTHQFGIVLAVRDWEPWLCMWPAPVYLNEETWEYDTEENSKIHIIRTGTKFRWFSVMENWKAEWKDMLEGRYIDSTILDI